MKTNEYLMTKEILLSETGGDRATGYTMSNKILRIRDKLLCTWLDRSRFNYWAIVDLATGSVESRGRFPESMVDNHCGLAIAVLGDGTVHAVSGAHNGTFQHYVLSSLDKPEWHNIGTVGNKATYPNLIVDKHDTLHLCYRLSTPQKWILAYQRLSKGGKWTEPTHLVRNAYNGYVYWTNSLAVAPNNTIHLVFVVRRLLNGGQYYGAGHMYSADGGNSWHQNGDKTPISLPLNTSGAKIIGGEPLEEFVSRPKKTSSFYLEAVYNGINLSNTAVDGQGQPWFVLHRLQREATLCRLTKNGWKYLELLPLVNEVLPKWRIHTQSSIVVQKDGSCDLALMVAPGDKFGWGPSETEILRMRLAPDGTVRKMGLVDKPDPGIARWLPSLEHRVLNAGSETPALVFTDGINAGGAFANKNKIKTKVRLQY